MNTNDVFCLASALAEQHGREPYLESKQAIGRAALTIAHAAGLDREARDRFVRWATGAPIPATTAGHQFGERQAFPGVECPYCKLGELQLVEQGHERTWDLTVFEDEDDDDLVTAHFSGIEDYSDDGDGDYYTRCSSCLAEFQAPEDDWEWN